jgi:hypothetical protein
MSQEFEAGGRDEEGTLAALEAVHRELGASKVEEHNRRAIVRRSKGSAEKRRLRLVMDTKS